MLPIIVIFAGLLFFFGLASRRFEQSIITGPMVFTLAGLLLAFFITSESNPDLALFTGLGKLALSIVLFTDATHIRVRDLLRRATLPGRLLAVAMPLVIIAGTGGAMVLLADLSLWEAAILATVLAPTDAGLGQAILNSPRVPSRIREALNVEAGLNDGLAVPLLALFIGLARVDQPLQDYSWVIYTAQQIGLGLLAGLVIGGIGGWLLEKAHENAWVTAAFRQLCLLMLAVLAFFAAEMTGGNEFIAVFVAGLAVKYNFEDAGQQMFDFSAAWGQLVNLLVFFLFGLLTFSELGAMGWSIWLYAALSLTVVRMVPVLIALIGTRLQLSTMLFLGWFGPRGLASIVLGLILIKEEAVIPGQPLIELAVSAAVLLSIFAHGVTAVPGINLYSRQVNAMPDDAPEKQTPLVTTSSLS